MQDGMVHFACALQAGTLVHQRRSTQCRVELSSEVLEAVRKVASENGLATVETLENGDCGLDAMLQNCERLGIPHRLRLNFVVVVR